MMNIEIKTCSFRAALKGILFIAIVALLLGVSSGVAIAELVWENGEYRIYTSADLEVMSGWVNNMHSADVKYRLMEDIDLDGMDIPWLPIGANSATSFNGEFNGGRHAIRNFVISRDADWIGLFGVVSSDAKISDLRVISFDVRGQRCAGGLIGYNEGTISTSYASGAVNGNELVGGLVGDNSGTIITSYASVAVNGYWYVGGLVGRNESTVSRSYASGTVSGVFHIGGLVGWNEGTISASYANGAVSGFRDIGGLAGRNNKGTINSSYAIGTVNGKNEYIGGLVGNNYEGIINTSYASGMTIGDAGVGGLVGGESSRNNRHQLCKRCGQRRLESRWPCRVKL